MKYIKVGDRVRWKSIYGTVTSVLKNTFFVHWDDGDCSTEGIETYSLCGIELLLSRQDTLVEKYIQKIKDKYPEEEEQKKHAHYFKESGYKFLDVYRTLQIFEVTDPCIQHAIKKLLVSGNRGFKDIEHDIQDTIDTLERWKEMRNEERERIASNIIKHSNTEEKDVQEAIDSLERWKQMQVENKGFNDK